MKANKDRIAMKRTPPLMLASSVNIAPGTTALAPSIALTHPYRLAMWIDSISWSLYAAGTGGDPWNFGGVISTRISMGRTEVTRNRSNGFVPIWNLAYQTNDDSACNNQTQTLVGTGMSTSCYRWKLPRPFYIPPGMTLQSEFQRSSTLIIDGSPTGVPVTVSVAYAGRYVDPLETTRHYSDVPFATYAEAQPGDTSFMSNENDFVNPYLVPLNTQRFIARGMIIDQTGGHPYPREAPLGMTTSAVKIQDSSGNNIVRDFVTSGSQMVFDNNRRGWTFANVLPPKERYNVQLQPSLASTFGATQMVSLIGWRREEFA